jgi:hypothetical protein
MTAGDNKMYRFTVENFAAGLIFGLPVEVFRKIISYILKMKCV